ncbi:MAG: triose-phosphate isomerase [Alphaproteobacteria bacterium]|nr:triose-phosphate isomerase [Alphaproteobacteria bacterium]
MKKLIAGNWKMNGSILSAQELTKAVIDGIERDQSILSRADFVVCPPFLHLERVKTEVRHGDQPVSIGAQDCALTDDGAYTGDVSAAMLKDFGCDYVILGHSERRQYHKETDEVIAAKAIKAHESGLIAIICVGELESEREAGREKDVVRAQLAKAVPAGATAANTVIAYEPVWAIGTGKTATPEDVKEMHSFIRAELAEKIEDSTQVRILYGGSVKPDNAKELFAVPNVDGALIGGASLKAEQYLAIAKAS